MCVHCVYFPILKRWKQKPYPYNTIMAHHQVVQPWSLNCLQHWLHPHRHSAGVWSQVSTHQPGVPDCTPGATALLLDPFLFYRKKHLFIIYPYKFDILFYCGISASVFLLIKIYLLLKLVECLPFPTKF